ncbi:alpha/beta-hydrolase [Exidia glandulosa HHB12029]|uniref:Alpha/beta-hydrolase n=1 Tax=Exidia glandulosa HHB12029 TaxID=1314781 RepID=A0A165MAI2_EXIGL|nr:alpha/beta-hydrolase [Exidia glandulosa HHB12029]
MATLTWFERLRLNLWIMLMNAVIRILVREPPRSGLLPATTDLTPTLRLRVPSRSDPKRSIAVNVFYPPDYKHGSGEKLPVHLNAHGSGFCFKNFGEDTEFSAFIAQSARCIVLDSDYAKAPSHPFPAAYNDIADVVAYILSKPDDWDLTRFTMGGCSSGACLILSVAASLPKGTVKGLQIFYPPVDLSDHESNWQPTPELPKGNPGLPFSLWRINRFREAYVPPGVDRLDPRMSPVYAPVDAFPPVTVICGSCDPMVNSIRRFVTQLREGGNDIVDMEVEGAGHGWERLVKPNTKFVQLREDALELYISRLQASWNS